MISTEDYALYTIDINYLRYLYSIDKEVYYNPSYKTRIKPFVGIITGIQNNEYFIPLTSAKPKHKKWRNVSSSHFLVYETIRKNIDHIIVNDDIYKKGSKEEEIIHVLSVLDIKKMIPLVQNCYEKIDIENINDKKFQSLLKKELDFCKKHKKKILKKVENFYTTQVKNNTVKFASCNFALLEKAMEDYKKEKE